MATKKTLMTRALRLGGLVCLVLVLAVGSYWVYLYSRIRDAASRDEARTADAIVVLGAAQYNGRPSPVLKARLDHVLSLYKSGYARNVITTGSYGPDPERSEAHVSAEYLIENGIDAADISTEQAGLTTRESIRAAAMIMKSKHWTNAVVVSDGFHLYRLKTIFNDEDITAFTSPAPNSPIEAASSQRFWFSLREVFLVSAYRLIDF